MYKLIFLLVLLNISASFGQSRIQAGFGVSPYTYYFSERLGDFNFSINSPLPTFELRYNLEKNNSIYLKKSVIRWSPKEFNSDIDTSYLVAKNFKIVSLGLSHNFKLIHRLDFQIGAGIAYVYGYDSILQAGTNEINIIGIDTNSLGLEVVTKLKFQYMRSLYISPTLNLNLTPQKGLNMFSGIVMFEFDF